ncbi:hypothetical protein, partial [Acinetobacter baumannii]|uniref:hypothetical protein n=1 Tax=Acinetobacter baumannii TaxID=470 RepID=UPI003AF9CF01
EDSMHFGAMDPDCMHWSLCSEAQCILIDCSGFFAAWPKASRLNGVDSMHCDWNPLHSIGMLWAMLHKIHCIQSCCMESTAFNHAA